MKKYKNAMAVLLLLAVVLQALPAFAYTAGPTRFSVKLESVSDGLGSYAGEAALHISAGGYALYDCFVPFVSDGVQIKYSSSADAALTFCADDESYSVMLPKNQGAAELAFPAALEYGDKYIKLSSNADVDISEIAFLKKNQFDAADYAPGELNYTEAEDKMQTSFIGMTGSSIYILRNGRKYTDPKDESAVLELFGGSAYIPIEAAAKIFSCYFEADFSSRYAFMRLGDAELYTNGNGEVYVKKDNAVAKSDGAGFVFEKNRVYVPLRSAAEFFGFTVLYKDGVIVCDSSRNRAKDIIEDKKLFSDIVSELSQSRPDFGGSVYYVSKSAAASDENSGSADSPFATISKACDMAKAGDTVIIGGGTYREVLKPKNSGTASKPIVFTSAPGEEVIISAAEPVGKLTEYKGNILTGTIDWDLGNGKNQLFLNNTALDYAKHPNTNTGKRKYPDHLNLSNIWPKQGNILVDANDSAAAVSETDLNQTEPDYWKGAALVSFHGYAWCTGIAEVTGSSYGRLTLGNTTKMWWFDRNKEGRDTDFAFLTDHVNCIDLPGEYIVKNKRIYVYLPEGYNKDNLTLEAKKRMNVIDLSDREYIRVNGIKTIGASAVLKNSRMCTLSDMDMKYVSHVIYSQDQRDGYIDDAVATNSNGAPQRGEVGNYISGRDNTVIGCDIQDSSMAAIYIDGNYINIEDNYICDCNYLGSDLPAVFVNTSWEDNLNAQTSVGNVRGGHIMTRNTIKRVGRSAIAITAYTNFLHTAKKIIPMAPMDVAFNELYDGNIVARDTGPFYMWSITAGTDFNKTKVHNNMVYDSWCSDGHNAGLYFDDRTNMAEAYDNIIFSSNKELSAVPVSFAVLEQVDGYVEKWNNNFISYLPGGRAALTDGLYPEGKTFYTGCDRLKDLTKGNKDKFFSEDLCILAEKASVSDEGMLSGGKIKFASSGQSAKFKSVAIGGDDNILRIYFGGRQYGVGDEVTVRLNGDGITSDYKKILEGEIVYSENPPYKNCLTYVDVVMYGLPSGTYDIDIICDKPGDMEINKVLVMKNYDDTNITANVFAKNYETFKAGDGAEYPWAMTRDGKEIFGLQYVNGTWDGTYYSYDVTTLSPSEAFYICAGSDGSWLGGEVYVHIGSPDSEPIAKAVISNFSWSNFSYIYAKLDKPLEAGKRKIYLTYHGDGKCSNVERFGFVKNMPSAEVSE